MVQFPNDECISSSSSTTNGTCYTVSEVQHFILNFFLFCSSVAVEEELLQALVLQASGSAV